MALLSCMFVWQRQGGSYKIQILCGRRTWKVPNSTLEYSLHAEMGTSVEEGEGKEDQGRGEECERNSFLQVHFDNKRVSE